MPATLEYVQCAGNVAFDVRVRILDRVAHARLRREVHDPIETFAREQVLDCIAVDEIHAHEPESVAPFELREPRLFERDVVIVIQIVQTDDLVAALEQILRDVKADKPRCSGNEYSQSPAPCLSLCRSAGQSRPSESAAGSAYLMS